MVAFCRKSDVLLAPNIVVTFEPPNVPDNPPPFDDCTKITDIKSTQISTKNTIKNVIIMNKYILIVFNFQ